MALKYINRWRINGKEFFEKLDNDYEFVKHGPYDYDYYKSKITGTYFIHYRGSTMLYGSGKYSEPIFNTLEEAQKYADEHLAYLHWYS